MNISQIVEQPEDNSVLSTEYLFIYCYFFKSILERKLDMRKYLAKENRNIFNSLF